MRKVVKVKFIGNMPELKTYKKRVHHILKIFPNARNSDGTLLAHYIATFEKRLIIDDVNGEPSIKLRNLKHLPPIENLRRSRQIIQNDNGDFLPTDIMVRKARGIKEKNWRECEVREAQQEKMDI